MYIFAATKKLRANQKEPLLDWHFSDEHIHVSQSQNKVRISWLVGLLSVHRTQLVKHSVHFHRLEIIHEKMRLPKELDNALHLRPVIGPLPCIRRLIHSHLIPPLANDLHADR
jgi:hypothetical protein